jgi:hypothetical protein
MRRVTAAMIAFVVTHGAVRAAGPVAQFAGDYLAGAPDDRCSLKLKKTGLYALSCEGRALASGTARLIGPAMAIEAPTVDPPAHEQSGLRMKPAEPHPQPWPPSLQDPTAPLVSSEVPRMQLVLLTPLRWGARQYLVRTDALASFCRAIAQGTEPRRVAYGLEFLRSGDHRKPVEGARPAECASFR